MSEFVLCLAGIALGFLCFYVYHRYTVGGFEKMAQEIVARGEKEAHEIRKQSEFELKQNQIDQRKQFEEEWQIERRKMQREEDRLKQREDKLEQRIQAFDKKVLEVERKEEKLQRKNSDLDEERETLKTTQQQLALELEKISGLTRNEARELLIDTMTHEVKADAANLIRRIKKEAEEDAEREASKIIATAIHRLAVPCVSESTVNTVNLPNDEIKGRIIGREGRNIRALEQATGISFMIDDTPGAVVLSGFDPIRLHTAKLALQDLISDGRIHPTRIEEAVEKAKSQTKKKMIEAGEDAAIRAGVMNLHPEIIKLLGKLNYRFSYGQNVLEHSLEVSHLMGLMAAELGLDEQMARRIGLLHDMGKALTHELQGSHAIIGHDFALKYGESAEVANGIGCHHQEMEPMTIEGSLCGAADAISGARPGARVEALEEYVKRLNRLEELAYEYPGVEKAYALQAGREIRIAVLPDMIDDDGVVNLARDLTKRIEKELQYPGKIKVTVVRERRVIEYAL